MKSVLPIHVLAGADKMYYRICLNPAVYIENMDVQEAYKERISEK